MRRGSPPHIWNDRSALRAPRLGEIARAAGARRRLSKGEAVFSAGDAVRHLLVVESGELVVGNARHGVLTELRAGDAVLLACGERRALDCEAATTATVLAVGRRLVETWAEAEPELAGELARLHAAELKLMLAAISSSLAPASGEDFAWAVSDFVEEGVDDVRRKADLPGRRCGWPSGAETGKPSAPRSGILPFRRCEDETRHA